MAKPPTSNKKFHRNTEDVLKSSGTKTKSRGGICSLSNGILFPPKKKKKKEKKEKKKKKKKKETKRKRRKEAEEKLFYKTGTCTRESGTRRAMYRLQMRRACTLGRTETRSTGNCTQILQGKKRPDSGIITYKKDGTIYEYYRKGYGKLVRADGSSYIGNFNERGEFSGFGKFTSAPQKTTKDASASASREACAQHEGLYREGKPNGPGQFRFANGDMYQGEFVDGFFTVGERLFSTRMGDRYDGEFSRGAFNENGVYTWKNGNCYVGKWKNNKMHGPGAFSDGEEVFILCEYNNGKRIREEKKGELPEALNSTENECKTR